MIKYSLMWRNIKDSNLGRRLGTHIEDAHCGCTLMTHIDDANYRSTIEDALLKTQIQKTFSAHIGNVILKMQKCNKHTLHLH